MTDFEPNFVRYLAAKRTVDDRALNRNVWNTLSAVLPPVTADRPLRVIEVGAGVGTMLERMTTRRMLKRAVYTAVDADAASLREALRLLPIWAGALGCRVSEAQVSRAHPGATTSHGARLTNEQDDIDILVELEAADVFDFVAREAGRRSWDVLLAHAFLDLLDIPSALPKLLSLVRPGGLCYLTINFDGATILQPEIEPAFDDEIERLYHRTMDERMTGGQRSGDSRSGRHLFGLLRDAGVNILDAGSSDWVVFAGQDGYPADEAYFLHFIIDTMRGAIIDHPALVSRRARFADWIEQRRRQIDENKLVYIAHQLDFVGQVPGGNET